MSNPFKIKKLEEFTIEDCESYLQSYAYGEHHVEVRKRLSGLKSGKIKEPETVVEKKAKPVSELSKPKPHKEPVTSPTSTYSQPSQSSSQNQQNVQTNAQSDYSDIGDTILAWVGLIVIVLIAGSIIIWAIDALLPKEVVAFIGKYKYGIYVIGLAIGRWIEAAEKTWK